ncbi:MAG: nitrate reductase cytochrome c-type subunit [Burkholderiaceae bacterium]
MSNPRQTLRAILVATGLVLAGCAGLQSLGPIEDAQFGFNKGSVFDVATPVPFGYDDTGAARSVVPLAGSGMPPMVPHTVDDDLPITLAKNGCLECHDKPNLIGRPVAKGKARPAPRAHYVVSAGGSLALAGANYNCVSCHAPQADVPALVTNRSR